MDKAGTSKPVIRGRTLSAALAAGMIFFGCGAKTELYGPDVVMGETEDARDAGDPGGDTGEEEEPPVPTWILKIGGAADDRASSIAERESGGWVVAGATQSYGAGGDVWLIEMDGSGRIMHQTTYGSFPSDWAGPDALSTYGEGLLLAGGSDGRDAEGDAWVVLMDADGLVEWTRLLGGEQSDTFSSAAVCGDGGIILAGWSMPARGDFVTDAMVAKTFPGGRFAWRKVIGGDRVTTARSLSSCRDDGILVVGETADTPDGSLDGWVARLDAEGGIVWQKTIGGPASDWALTAVDRPDGGFFVAGITESYGAGAMDAWVLALDASGGILWQKTVGGAGDDWAAAAVPAGGGLVVAGTTASSGLEGYDMLIFRMDMEGGLVWQMTVSGGSREEAAAIAASGDGGFLVAGSTTGLLDDFSDIMLVRLDGNGTVAGRCDLLREGSSVVLDSDASVADGSLVAGDADVDEWEADTGLAETEASAVALCPQP
jgi:hypothetical protein